MAGGEILVRSREGQALAGSRVVLGVGQTLKIAVTKIFLLRLFEAPRGVGSIWYRDLVHFIRPTRK